MNWKVILGAFAIASQVFGAHVVLTAQRTEVKVGDSIDLQIPVGQDETAPYEWVPTQNDASVLLPLGRTVLKSGSSVSLVGGIEPPTSVNVFHFQAIAPGVSTVQFGLEKYGREAASRLYSFDIAVEN